MNYIVHIQCHLKYKCKGIICSRPVRISLIPLHYCVVVIPVLGRRNQNIFSLPTNVNLLMVSVRRKGRGILNKSVYNQVV